MMLTSYVPLRFTRACPEKQFLVTDEPPLMLMMEGVSCFASEHKVRVRGSPKIHIALMVTPSLWHERRPPPLERLGGGGTGFTTKSTPRSTGFWTGIRRVTPSNY